MISTVNVVTSCSVAGWVKYGARFVETFEQYWPKSITLHVVSEDVLPHEFITPSSRFWALDDSLSWRKFHSINSQQLWTHGDSSTPRPSGCAPRWREKSGYNFRFDAYKFSKKVFAVELLAKELKEGRLLWLDADTLTFAPVPEDLPERLLPGTSAISCLPRIGYHSECGFVGYNLDTKATLNFIRAFAGLYHTGEVFKLAEWHDSWVFDWLRNKLLTPTHAIPYKAKGHPFINSELGRYMDHCKGQRKDKGRSQFVEQVNHTKLPYWQGRRV